MIRLPRRRLIALAVLLCVAPASAAKLEDKQGELSALRGRIETLQRDLAGRESSHSEAADQLRDTEIAISMSNRQLRALAQSRLETVAELAALDTDIRTLDDATRREQQQLARLLNRQFVGGDADALRLLLLGSDPNSAARDRYLLTRLSQAKAALAKQLQSATEKKRSLRERVQARQAHLHDIEQQQSAQRAQLLAQQQMRQKMLATLAHTIATQRRTVGALRRDAQRLGNLIDGLLRISAQKKARQNKTRAKETFGGTAPASNQATSTPRRADPGNVDSAFGRLRGQLGAPVAGTLAARFGAPRDNTGGLWKGLFFRAIDGTEVHAIAAGTVVFADWLRGFGNLLIVDHGDDFHSIYAYNQALLKAVGEPIRSGEPIATVGNSGGNAQSGLYFELRYQGQAFDPQKWLRR